MENTEDKRLFLLDAYALIYRAYFAFARNPLINSKGMNVSAISGFTNTLFELLEKEKPTHIAVVFDAPGPTDREKYYEAYKANREAMPEDIALSIPLIKSIIDACHIPHMQLSGFEADDIIGTLARKAEDKGYTTFMVTPDKDYAQLVTPNTFIYKPSRQSKGFEVMGVDEVLEKWSIENPLQVIDILGLWGDSVDNIPGIPGIGEKTSKILIGKYGSIENLLKNVEDLKGKQKENVINFGEQGLLSKKLATIILDVPVEFDDDKLIMEDPDKEKLSEIFRELEFRSMGKRILGEEYEVNQSGGQMSLFGGQQANVKEEENVVRQGKNITNTSHIYTLVDTPEERKKLADALVKADVFCFDTETTGVDPNEAELVGISFCMKPGEAFYVPVSADYDEACKIVNEFKSALENKKSIKIAQNLKYDLIVMRWYGVDVAGHYEDTMLAHYLIEPEMRHKMDILAETYLGYTPVPIEELIGKKGPKQKSMRDIPADQVAEYAAEDADITFQLYDALSPELKKREVEDLYRNVEVPLLHVLADMEYEGVALDTKFLKDYSKELQDDIKLYKRDIFRLAGEEFNLDSPKQLGVILFNKMEIPYVGKKTKTGQFSTNEDTLSRIAAENEIADIILNYRELNKLKSTYVDAFPALINPKTGRLHTTFSQTVAATGRLSSLKPNLQNIPIRTSRGREIRKAFIARDQDHILLSADYSQVELRIIADISKDENMLAAFRDNLDIHAATASRVYGVPLEEVNSDMRRNAKTVNFGIIYGISAFGLSQRLGIPRGDAQQLIDNYFSQYPGVKSYMESTVEEARKSGYVSTILGRRRYLKDINSRNATVRGHAERNAINTPIQGSAADLIKVAMINIHKELGRGGFQSKMTLQVHDELVFDVKKEELDDLKPMVEDKMRNAIKMEVPIEVESGIGQNWLEAH